MQRNDAVVKAFLDGGRAHGRSLMTNGMSLYSYGTEIARRLINGQVMEVLRSRSTVTTEKHRGMLRRAAERRRIEVISIEQAV